MPSLAWVEHLELVALDPERNTAQLRPRPGHADLAKFAVGRQLDRLKAELAAVTDRRLELTILAPGQAAPGVQPAQASGDAAGTPADPASNASIRRQVMDLPLVRDALDAFPDATLIDAREEPPETPDR